MTMSPDDLKRVVPAKRSARGALTVPEQGVIGLGRDFADLYHRYLESPRAFFYFAFLAAFGVLVAKKVKLASSLDVQPRLYVVLVGASGDTRKSTAIARTEAFFRSLGCPLPILHGVGSAEGLAKALKKHDGVLLLSFDELKGFVEKARIEGSVLLPMVTTLFELGDWDNETKKESITIRDAALALIAACTTDTYATMFDRRFFAIGFLNRIWLVSGQTDKCFPVPMAIPEAELNVLRDRAKDILGKIEAAYQGNGKRPVPYAITPEAQRLFADWYERRKGSIFERRLDTYGHRLALLLAVTNEKTEIDADTMRATIALLEWQLDLRRELDPIDAENTIAELEEKIRRVLHRGPMKESELKRKCNYSRYGLWAWNTAVENLKKAGEVTFESRTGLVTLGPASLAASA